MKILILLLLAVSFGCSKNNKESFHKKENYSQHSNSGDFGVIEYNKSLIKSFSVEKNISELLSPLISGDDAQHFSFAYSQGCSSLSSTKCMVKILFSAQGKPARIYNASLEIGSHQFSLTATILSSPSVVYTLYKQNQVALSPLSLGDVSGTNHQVIWFKIVNESSVVGTASSLSLDNTIDFKLLYSNCENISLKPGQSCRFSLGIKGDNQIGNKTASLSFGPLTVSLAYSTSTAIASANFQPVSNQILLGSTSEANDQIMKAVVLINNGQATGSISSFDVPSNYQILSHNCASVKPTKQCLVRFIYTNNAPAYGEQNDILTLGNTSMVSVVQYESSLENLGTISLSVANSNIETNLCYPVTINLKESSGADFKRALPFMVNLNQASFSDSNCLNPISELPIESYTSEKFFMLKILSPNHFQFKLVLTLKVPVNPLIPIFL